MIRVLNEDVLVLLEKKKEVEKGGFIDPSEKDERLGKVVDYGCNVDPEIATILEDEPKIKYKEFFTGEKIAFENQEYIVINYKDILVIYE